MRKNQIFPANGKKPVIQSTWMGSRTGVPRPFLKWAGGKRQLLDVLREHFPERFNRFHEPFVGGGAVFFGLLPERAVLADNNRELINCYVVIRDRVEELIAALEQHVYDRDHYYRVRDLDPDDLLPVAAAARTIYLNRAGFNGLYRVNSRGRFNVPFGRYSNPRICNAENLRACSRALAGATLLQESFENVLDRAQPGDLVYLDPPYIPLESKQSFTAYQKRGFGMDNQEKLADVFDALAGRGAHVVLSNSDVPWVHERYAAHEIHRINAWRHINRNASERGPVGEVVVVGRR